MKIITVTHNSREVVCLSLHNIFKNVDVSKHKLIVCDNSTESSTSDMLRDLGRRGYLTYVDGVQDRAVRGSVNHRNGLIKCLELCGSEKVLILDCDAFPVSNPLPMMNKLKGKEKIIGAIHPRGYIHPSILAGNSVNILEILLAEREAIASTGKHIDTFESVPINENLIALNEQYMSDRVEAICVRNNMPRAMCSYNLGSCEFYHMWYFTRTNGYRTAVDGIPKEDMVELRNIYRNTFVNEISVIIPTYGIDDQNFLAIDSVVESLKNQNTSYKYNIWIALFSKQDLQISIDRDNFKGCNVHHIFDMERWSRAEAFNRAVMSLPYSGKYVLHDRDITVPDCFIEQIGNSPYPYVVNYRSIFNGDKAEHNSVGGSSTINWEYMITSGGMCSDMKGWGAEDREFDYRVSMIKDGMRTGRKLPMSLMHIPHSDMEDRPMDNQHLKITNQQLSKDHLKKLNYMFMDYLRYWDGR